MDILYSLNDLAETYRATGDYLEAEPLYHEALEILRASGKQDHRDFAGVTNNLAELYRLTGKYESAEALYKEAIEILGVHNGIPDADVATVQNNLGLLYNQMGNYREAEALYRVSLDALGTIYDEHHPSIARGLNNLASVLREIGDLKAAEAYYEQALEVRRSALGENHPDVAESLQNLAILHISKGSYLEAVPLLQSAVAIFRETLGDESPALATSMYNLGCLCSLTRNFEAAELLFIEALEIHCNPVTGYSLSAGITLNGLGVLYRRLGRYQSAEPRLKQAIEILRQTLGDDHRDVATCLVDLSWLYAATARYDEALAIMQQVAATDDRRIGHIFGFGSESQRAGYLKSIEGHLGIFLSLIVQHFSHSVEAVKAAFELVLRRKALGAEALATQRDSLYSGKYPALKPQMEQLATLRSQLARKSLDGPGSDGLPVFLETLAKLEADKKRMEGELARQVPEMNLEQKLRAVDLQVIARALPQDTTLIEFVRYNDLDFDAVPANGESKSKPTRYLAFTLSSERPYDLRMIDLGESAPIDRMIATFRATIIFGDEGQHERGLGAAPPANLEVKSSNEIGIKLHTALFHPILKSLGNRKRLLISADGELARLPFEVLPVRDKSLLIDEYRISYVSVGRDVLRFEAESNGESRPSLVIADPDFDFGNEKSASSQPPAKESGRQSRDLNRDGLNFNRLSGTCAEGKYVGELLKVAPWLEKAALEGRLKAYGSPKILHLATHGFFLEDQEADSHNDLRGLGMVGLGQSGPQRFSAARMENPLLRSGLALAGVNTWLKQGELPAEAEDGILTAEDVTGLDLTKTELVVLSACETGLGEIKVGEGVFGLRRAFVLAGAKTLVMSLWKVPDRQTQELMEEFYRRILSGEGRADALRNAQLKIKTKYPDQLYWGAFICQGDPRPMRDPVDNQDC